MIYGITFTDQNMTRSAELCKSSMEKNGVDQCQIFQPSDIDFVFKKCNEEILSQPRGAGYWLWKPYFIYTSMITMQSGDYLLYSDAGIEFISPIYPIIQAMGDEDIFLFSNGWPHLDWCKGNVTAAINGAIEWHHPQVQASNIFIRVNDKSKAIIKEWLLWCQFTGFIDDSPSQGNWKTFAEHRHDQSLLTEVAYKYKIRQHWFPSTTAEHLRNDFDNYPITFLHHRKRDNEWT